MIYAYTMYTTKQLAEKLGLKQKTVQKYCQLGYIKAIKIGRDWLITEEQLQEYLKKKK